MLHHKNEIKGVADMPLSRVVNASDAPSYKYVAPARQKNLRLRRYLAVYRHGRTRTSPRKLGSYHWPAGNAS